MSKRKSSMKVYIVRRSIPLFGVFKNFRLGAYGGVLATIALKVYIIQMHRELTRVELYFYGGSGIRENIYLYRTMLTPLDISKL